MTKTAEWLSKAWITQICDDPGRRKPLEQQWANYVKFCGGRPEIPRSVVPLSAGLKDSELVRWKQTAARGALAVIEAEQFHDFHRIRGRQGSSPGFHFNRILRAVNPSSGPRNLLQERVDEDTYIVAPIAAYGYIEDNIAKALIADTFPMLVMGLRERELRLSKSYPGPLVESLGEYCLALFADRQLMIPNS